MKLLSRILPPLVSYVCSYFAIVHRCITSSYVLIMLFYVTHLMMIMMNDLHTSLRSLYVEILLVMNLVLLEEEKYQLVGVPIRCMC